MYEIELIAFVTISLWILLHSILAMTKIKAIVPLNQQYFRLFYVIVAGLTLGIQTLILNFLSGDPNRIQFDAIINPTPEISFISLILVIIGSLIVIGTVLQTNPFKFLGLEAEDPNSDLRSGYFYRLSRHPMYTGAILVIGPTIFLTDNSVWFLQSLLFVLYFIFGALHEEYRLRHDLKGYSEVMYTRGYLFPWKLIHFKTLVGKNS